MGMGMSVYNMSRSMRCSMPHLSESHAPASPLSPRLSADGDGDVPKEFLNELRSLSTIALIGLRGELSMARYDCEPST